MYSVVSFLKTEYCGDLGPIISLAKNFIGLLRFGIPIVLIIMGTIDLGKAVLSNKDDEMKTAQKMLVKRLIYALAVFLVVTIVTFAIGLVSKNEEWHDCWVNTSTGKRVSDFD
ncbi:MAG: hypothetical protein IKF19_00665 [Bacilli bacterium]|nr:hypothetical protein [Bacilli bacterium]